MWLLDHRITVWIQVLVRGAHLCQLRRMACVKRHWRKTSHPTPMSSRCGSDSGGSSGLLPGDLRDDELL